MGRSPDVVVATGTTTGLLLAYGHDNNELEAIKTASTIVLGTGGAAALLLAARRQRSTEIALNQKDRDLQHQERDAIERRITDLYTKAADQLGSDKAPVRLAGLYALERVAQNNRDLRQTIVNVWCAYLRMPYDPPGDEADPTHLERLQEREVRLTAQRLIADHLHSGGSTFWSDITLDLTGATLIDFDLVHCTVHTSTFRSATFVGAAHFDGSNFTGDTDFIHAKFTGTVRFLAVTFNGKADFNRASFANKASFPAAHFVGTANFVLVTFGGDANFFNVTFERAVSFGKPILTAPTTTSFNGHTTFELASFNKLADFLGASFCGTVSFGSAKFQHDAIFEAATFNAIPNFGRIQIGGEPTSFAGKVDFTSATFALEAPPEIRQYL